MSPSETNRQFRQSERWGTQRGGEYVCATEYASVHDLLCHRRAKRGFVTGKEVRPMLMQSGLPTADLKLVWDIADPVSCVTT